MELKGESRNLKLTSIKGSKLAKWKRKQVYGVTAYLTMVEEDQIRQEEIPIDLEEL